ncbi:TDT family transporter [Lysinibacillus telephonicus]|uniref:hypothetical protein n=1 Tax=Lysinibacillus telephonicus TaxID=1714840 RepID=UPI003978F1C5
MSIIKDVGCGSRMIGKTEKTIDVASGAMIMAMGIFLLGAIHQFSYIEQLFDLLFVIVLITWIIILVRFIRSIFIVDFLKNLWNQSIQSFGLGTWIAATSVMTILIHQHFPNVIGIQYIVYLNCIAWLLYMLFSCLQLKKIIINRAVYDLHGVILLTTVSTQSIACLLMETIQKTNILIIVLGIVLYLFSIVLIVIRFKCKHFSLHEWRNTDCIIHGALSITGLAMTLSQTIEFQLLLIFWFVVFCLFIIVEIFEILRGISRVKLYGIRKAIFTYHISQWSRNFTFGMFYYFTFNLINYAEGRYELYFQTKFMYGLGWVVLVLLIVEIVLFLVPRKITTN